MKPFDLEKALSGSRVVTKEGKDVKNIALLKDLTEDEFRMVGVCAGEFFRWTEDGVGMYESDTYDLYLATEKCEGWVNVYREQTGKIEFGSKIYKNVTDAENSGKCNVNTYVCTTLITWEE